MIFAYILTNLETNKPIDDMADVVHKLSRLGYNAWSEVVDGQEKLYTDASCLSPIVFNCHYTPTHP